MSRFDLGLTDEQFLSLAPASLHILLQRAALRDRKAQLRAALVAATICNANNDWEKNPAGWSPERVLQLYGYAPNPDVEDLRSFIDEIEHGDVRPPDEDDLEAFRNHLLTFARPANA